MLPKRYNLTDLSDNIVLVQEVINMYVDQEMSLQEISIATRLTIHTVRTMLIENNVEMRQKNNK